MPASERAPNYRFGAFEFDGDSHELRLDGELVALRPQPASVLDLLLSAGGRVVTREELRDHIWGDDVNVDYEHSLNSCIRQIRVALGESADDPQYIQTLPRRGYRFIAEVDAEVPPLPGQPGSAEGNGGSAILPGALVAPRRAWYAAGTLLLVTIAVLLGGYIPWGSDAAPAADPAMVAPQVLAVLPFRSLSEDPEDHYFGEGLSEELVGRLGRLDTDQLVVLASNQALREAGEASSPLAAARDLGADLLLSGTVRRAETTVRVTSQLIRVADGSQVWAGNFDGDLADMFGIQKQITSQIVGALSDRLEVRDEVADTSGESPAYHTYLRALALYKRGTPEQMLASLPLYEEAIALDPTLAEAWAGLALALVEADVPIEEKRARAPEAARRALELDPTLASAHLALGELRMYYDWDLVAARADFERAVQHGPGMAMTHMGLAAVLVALGEPDRAVEQAREGTRLDPLSVSARSDTAAVLYLARRFDEAIEESRLVLDLEPDMMRAWHTLLYSAVAAGRDDTAREAARARLEAIGVEEDLLDRFDAEEHAGAMQIFWRRYAEWVESALPASVHTIAFPAWVELGEHDRALDLLERSVRDGSAFMMAYLGVVPYADPLRDTPRFRDLLDRVRRDASAGDSR